MAHFINPITGRKIKVGGKTYVQLLKNVNGEGSPRESPTRGSPTRGWHDDSPKHGEERITLKKKCGNRCFLLPEQNKFPICRPDSCEPDCRGILSAKIRARQYKYVTVAKAAQELQTKLCIK